MTDNEIIKALEICSHRNGDLPCEGCPVNIVQMCIEDLMSDALDLINRQKTEYERLLQKLQQAKSEVIKELAERLKESCVLPEFPFDEGYVMESTIDKIAKEMITEVRK